MKPLVELSGVALVACVTLAQAATDPVDKSPGDTPSLVARPSDVSAGRLVQSPEGTVIGTVHDVLREPGTGRPDYIVVSTDSGFKPIPSYAISHLLRDAHIVIDRSTLAAAPTEADAAHWREQADSYWSAYR